MRIKLEVKQINLYSELLDHYATVASLDNYFSLSFYHLPFIINFFLYYPDCKFIIYLQSTTIFLIFFLFLEAVITFIYIYFFDEALSNLMCFIAASLFCQSMVANNAYQK